MFHVRLSPEKQRKWPKYLAAAIVVILVAKYPAAAAHVADEIGVLVGKVARGLSVLASRVHPA